MTILPKKRGLRLNFEGKSGLYPESSIRIIENVPLVDHFHSIVYVFAVMRRGVGFKFDQNKVIVFIESSGKAISACNKMIYVDLGIFGRKEMPLTVPMKGLNKIIANIGNAFN